MAALASQGFCHQLSCATFKLLLSAIVLLVCHASRSSATAFGGETTVSYSQARLIRTQQGHGAAQALYQELLRTNPSDTTAATYIAASPETPARQDAACSYDNNKSSTTTLIHELRSILDSHNYTNAAVQNVLKVPEKLCYASCPVYVTPVAAGTQQHYPPVPKNGLETLIALFLLGLTQPSSLVEDQFGSTFLPLLQDLGLAFVDHDCVIPYVHIFPLQLLLPEYRNNLLLVTDLHPRILSCTTVGSQQHHTVMYIGPDSLALVQHFVPTLAGRSIATVLDICTGSGIQALSVVAGVGDNNNNNSCRRAICIDINPRALKFVKFNAALNGFEEKIKCILGNVVTGDYQSILQDDDDDDADEESSTAEELLQDGSVDLVLANPPFIPVPDDNEDVLNRYGLFSSGGPDGEIVLQGILKLASRILSRKNGMIAIVSEFMNPNSIELRQRLLQFQGDGRFGGVLLTNQFPVSAELYAARRADSDQEFHVWKQHLRKCGIDDISPGLLFLERGEGDSNNLIQHRVVPKTEQGSIWTPSNQEAVDFTRQALSEILK
jgi:methylase of polypeptide subunit release factors